MSQDAPGGAAGAALLRKFCGIRCGKRRNNCDKPRAGSSRPAGRKRVLLALLEAEQGRACSGGETATRAQTRAVRPHLATPGGFAVAGAAVRRLALADGEWMT